MTTDDEHILLDTISNCDSIVVSESDVRMLLDSSSLGSLRYKPNPSERQHRESKHVSAVPAREPKVFETKLSNGVLADELYAHRMITSEMNSSRRDCSRNSPHIAADSSGIGVTVTTQPCDPVKLGIPNYFPAFPAAPAFPPNNHPLRSSVTPQELPLCASSSRQSPAKSESMADLTLDATIPEVNRHDRTHQWVHDHVGILCTDSERSFDETSRFDSYATEQASVASETFDSSTYCSKRHPHNGSRPLHRSKRRAVECSSHDQDYDDEFDSHCTSSSTVTRRSSCRYLSREDSRCTSRSYRRCKGDGRERHYPDGCSSKYKPSVLRERNCSGQCSSSKRFCESPEPSDRTSDFDRSFRKPPPLYRLSPPKLSPILSRESPATGLLGPAQLPTLLPIPGLRPPNVSPGPFPQLNNLSNGFMKNVLPFATNNNHPTNTVFVVPYILPERNRIPTVTIESERSMRSSHRPHAWRYSDPESDDRGQPQEKKVVRTRSQLVCLSDLDKEKLEKDATALLELFGHGQIVEILPDASSLLIRFARCSEANDFVKTYDGFRIRGKRIKADLYFTSRNGTGRILEKATKS